MYIPLGTLRFSHRGCVYIAGATPAFPLNLIKRRLLPLRMRGMRPGIEQEAGEQETTTVVADERNQREGAWTEGGREGGATQRWTRASAF